MQVEMRKREQELLAKKQAVQFPLVELWAEYQMLRNFIFRTAWQMDRQNPLTISDMVSICNFRANRLCCEAADRAMQVHGAGVGRIGAEHCTARRTDGACQRSAHTALSRSVGLQQNTAHGGGGNSELT